ncbi:endolytic transglycosylase MltG [Micrococcoides hystricis]|uniref:Endolytic murein transglycosylase n=1 Tax=Micrococcoides hystricis TaxID=1572761 RepID=A0ABV6P9K8_9MICC
MTRETPPPGEGQSSDQPLTRRALRRARQQQSQSSSEFSGTGYRHSGASSSGAVPPPVPAVTESDSDVPFDQENPQPRSRREARLMEERRRERGSLFDQEQIEREHKRADDERRAAEAKARAEAAARAAEEQRRAHREKDRILQHIREQNAAWAMPKVETEEATPLPEEQLAETEAYQTEAIEIIEANKSGTVVDEHRDLLGYQTIELADTPAEELLANRRRKNRKKTLVLLTSLGVFALAIVVVAMFISNVMGDAAPKDFPGPGGEQVDFTVQQGEGTISIANRLTEEGVVASTRAFMDALSTNTSDREIQPGEYQMRSEMKASDAVDRLLEEADKVHYIAIRPGLRVSEVYKEISESTGLSEDDITAAAKPADFGLPADAETLEGYIRPGEYRVPVDAKPKDILKDMTAPTFKALEELGVTDPEEQYRALTIASILVGEANPEDYPKVAGIIENRLKPNNPQTNGYLQIDATVIYGLDVRRLQFTNEEKADKSNPYNSYAHKGLPPGPIGAPSQKALEAAANPEENDFYYWVTTNIETGETKFAKTYAEHNRYKAEYDEYCKDNPDICGN